MSNGIRQVPKTVWLLFDVDNGSLGAKNYMWWFESREKARAHKKEQNSNPRRNAQLVGPYRYRVVSADSIELEFHEYECRYWRRGKSHGSCTCKRKRRPAKSPIEYLFGTPAVNFQAFEKAIHTRGISQRDLDCLTEALEDRNFPDLVGLVLRERFLRELQTFQRQEEEEL